MSISAGPERERTTPSALTVLDTRLLDDWGQRLAATVRRGGRLLIAASGGSAAQAEQLAAQLNSWTGRSRTTRPAIALHAEAARSTATGPISLTAPALAPAAADDAGQTVMARRGYADELARQVREHGRPGDVLLAMSASGRDRRLVRAVAAAQAGGIAAWCLTGPAPNPLADVGDDVVCVYPAGARALALSATVREAHQVALHLICLSFDATLLITPEIGPERPVLPGAARTAAALPGAVRTAPPEAAPPSPLIARG